MIFMQFFQRLFRDFKILVKGKEEKEKDSGDVKAMGILDKSICLNKDLMFFDSTQLNMTLY